VRSQIQNENVALSRDDLFEVLSSDRRRYLIYFLESEGGEAELGRLARLIAALENDIEPPEVSDKEQKRVYISLYQSHVPKLVDYGLVEYDADEKYVTSTKRMREVTELFEESSHSWQLYYLLIGVVGLAALGATVAGISPLPAWIVSLAVVSALIVTSLAHYYLETVSVSGEPPAELL
jgi:hypothetical protein